MNGRISLHDEPEHLSADPMLPSHETWHWNQDYGIELRPDGKFHVGKYNWDETKEDDLDVMVVCDTLTEAIAAIRNGEAE